MDNYEFCVRFALAQADGKFSFKVLDYGCGAGQVVKAMRDRGLDAYGCEAFYEGGDSSSLVPAELLGRYVLPMQGDRVPFEDETFDLVMSNQVLEHVADLDVVVSEIARVLKPGGKCLSIFPDRGIWREGHCGIPFLHWFPKGTQPRIYYAWALRTLGLGYHKTGKTRRQWARDFCDWLDNWTFYRSYEEIQRTFGKYLSSPDHIEAEWFVARLPRAAIAPASVRRWVAWKAGGLIFVTDKPAQRRAAGHLEA